MKELSLNILDILENSIKAEAKNIRLLIDDDDVKDMLYIEVSDDGVGMDDEMTSKVFDPFVTSSTNKKVGLGLPLLKYEAESCDGFVKVESKKNQGTKVSIMFKKSHIDRPPLGDIASSVVTVFLTHPEINFEYIHVHNGRQFSISSEELHEAAGDSFDSPLIIKGIHELITSSLNSLYGGEQWTR